jgi:hypothetical protein
MGMMYFVISPFVFYSSGSKVLSNVSHLIKMITLIRGKIFSLSLTLMIFLESLWRVILFMKVGLLLKMRLFFFL